MTLIIEQSPVPVRTTSHRAPRALNELQTLLVSVWSEALGQPHLSPDNDFFDLGGNSLVVLRLRRRLAAEGIHLGMADVFRYPNIRALAGYLAR